MKVLTIEEEILNVKEGDTLYHFNPYDATDNKHVRLHKMKVLGVDKEEGRIFYNNEEGFGRKYYASDMVGYGLPKVKKTFLIKEEAEAFLAEYHQGSQYGVVVEHHNLCRRDV